MRWIDQFGDRDGDGFQEYATRSKHGYYNQGWKDAGDADPARRRLACATAPRPVRAPGLCLRRQAAAGRHLRGPRPDRGRASACAPRRPALYERFNDAFWWEARGHLLPRARRRRSDRSSPSPRTPATASRAGSSRPSGPRGWSSGSWPTTCGPAGGSGRSRRTTSRTTRSATTRARSGRTTTR